jgi:hypothetical protein
MVGVYSIAFGVLMLILAFRLRGMANRTPTDQQTRAHA